MASFLEHKQLLVESKAEVANLRSRVDVLGSEMAGMKQKLVTIPDSTSPSKKKRIPRELSVGLIDSCF